MEKKTTKSIPTSAQHLKNAPMVMPKMHRTAISAGLARGCDAIRHSFSGADGTSNKLKASSGISPTDALTFRQRPSVVRQGSTGPWPIYRRSRSDHLRPCTEMRWITARSRILRLDWECLFMRPAATLGVGLIIGGNVVSITSRMVFGSLFHTS